MSAYTNTILKVKPFDYRVIVEVHPNIVYMLDYWADSDTEAKGKAIQLALSKWAGVIAPEDILKAFETATYTKLINKNGDTPPPPANDIPNHPADPCPNCGGEWAISPEGKHVCENNECVFLHPLDCSRCHPKPGGEQC